jgi:UDP-N-acetylmuramate: L-alanyl-gamma-D-glutamyl-meso-diaminopimelate ligase
MPPLDITPSSKIHLIGISGTGMGTLAGLLKESGFDVRGSDVHAYPPMSLELKRLGVPVMEGYSPSNLDWGPDLVVVGNVCRPDHVEAAAAIAKGIPFASMPTVLHDLFLRHKRAVVIAGTHGKTTTTALAAYLLHAAGRDPSMLVGGITANFGRGYLVGEGPDFVIEGDEYDSAYFEKRPKFLSYAPKSAVITSVEHDHIDIYPSFETYQQAFRDLVALVPPPGPIAVFGGDPAAVAVAVAGDAKAEVIRYAVEGDAVDRDVHWTARPLGGGEFRLAIGGQVAGRFKTPIGGRHNLRNTLAALIMAHVGAGVPLGDLSRALPGFKSVARRQEVIGRPGDITVYDDFAHHPTAVRETLESLRANHPEGRLLAAFEPRSATACRRLHQEAYASAFDAATRAVIAPPGRDLPEDEKLDTARLADALRKRGIDASAPDTIDDVLDDIVGWARPGDAIALLSNGGFGGLHRRLLDALS